MEPVCVSNYKEFRNTVKRAILFSTDLTDVVFKGAYWLKRGDILAKTSSE